MKPFDISSQAAKQIIARFDNLDIISNEFRGDITLSLPSESLPEVIRYAKEAADFNMLVNICSVDNMGKAPRYQVLYHLTQAETGANLTLSVKTNDSVPSVCPYFASANWHERETYDLMGIQFSGHPDLRRIMMWEGYPFYPLRKDFPLEGIPTEMPDVAFTEAAPTQGAPFATTPCSSTSAQREPRSHN